MNESPIRPTRSRCEPLPARAADLRGAGGPTAPAADACSGRSASAYAESSATTAVRTELRLLDAAALPGRLALSPDEAAAAIGSSRTFVNQHVIHELRVIGLAGVESSPSPS